MTEEESVNKITLANYFGGIKRFKWWVLATTVLTTLLGFVVVKFALNKNREELQSDFGYNINLHFDAQGEKSSDLSYSDLTQYLADNSIYNYSDIISEERLTAVKESKDDYASINVKAILESNAIQLEREGYTDTTTGKMVYTYPEKYSLSVKTKFFPNVSVGKSFVKDLIEYELVVASKANNSYTVPFLVNDSFESMTLNNRIEVLEKQYEAINSTYVALNSEFAEGSLVAENVTLGTRYNTFKLSNTVGAFTKYNELKNEYYQYHYINPTTDTVESLTYRAEEHKNKIKDSLTQIAIYEDALQALTQTTSIITVEGKNELQQKILELTEKINEYKLEVYKSARELKNIGYVVPDNSTDITLDDIAYIVLDDGVDAEGSIQYLNGSPKKPANWEDNCTKFVAKVNSYVATLKQDAEDCTNAYHNLYNNYKNKVNFYTTNFAVVTGSINIVYGIVIGLLGGFIVSSIVAMAVHINKPVAKPLKKKEE